MNDKAWLTVLAGACLMGLVNCTTAPRNFVTGPQGESVAAASGTPQSHTINGAFAVPLAVTVNQHGSPASGIVVTFTAPTGGASGKFADTSTASTTAMTDANGVATSASFIANGTAGAYTVTASAQGAQASVPFSLTNTTGAPAVVLATSGMAQSAGINSTYAPLVVKVVDAGQNPVQYAVVLFSAPATGASATFADTGTNTTSATTDASGVAASTALTANSTAGANSVNATVAGATPAVFNLTNLAGAALTITATSGTQQKAVIDTGFSTQLVATVLDGFSNPVSGVAVTFSAPPRGASGSFSNGTTTETDVTDANGMATSTLFSANSTAGGPYTVTASVGGVATLADFSLTNTLPFKTYVFSLSGEEFNTFSFYALAGAVQIDSSGNVLGGEQDYNDGAFGIASPPAGDTITGGTLKVNASTGQGTLVLNTDNFSLGVNGNGIETFAVQFVNVKHALINQFDGTATSSGSMDVQTLPAALSGGYAFTLAGVDPNSLPVAFGGVFTINGGTNLQNGLLDTNDEGTTTTGTALTGTLSPPDSFGRGTITSTINYTSLFGTPAPVVLNYYVVGPEVLRIIDVDSPFSGSVNFDSALGSAFGQGVNATSSGNASLGSSVFGIIGNTLSQFAAAGMFTTSSSAASFSGIADDDEFTNGVQISASPISGNYSIGANGYGSLTITSGSLGDVSVLGLYLTDPNLNLNDPNNTSTGLGGALVADMDAILPAGTGVLIPQTDTSPASFTGSYAFAGQAYASLLGFGEFDFVGRGKVTSGVLSGTALVSDPFLNLGTKPTDTGVKVAGTPLADPSNPGYYTLLSTNPTPNPLAITVSGSTTDFDVVIYQASGGQLFWLNEDPTGVFLGSLQQQTSLSGLPLARIGPVAPRVAAAHKDGLRR